MGNLLLMYLKTGISYIILLRFVNKNAFRQKKLTTFEITCKVLRMNEGEALHSSIFDVNYMQNSRHVF